MQLITIAGRLGVDPEIRFTSNGQKVTSLRVATNSRRGSKEETIWWRVTVWGENLDKIISFLKKGSAVIIVGELSKPEIFTDREGNPQVSLNITASNIMFSPFGRTDKSENASVSIENAAKSQPEKEEEYASFTQGEKEESKDSDFSDDEIPF
jgi:single-strand DNA-binding protein